jgi:cellulase/cellobiase CelA1
MRYRFSVVLAGAAVVSAGLVVGAAAGAGAVPTMPVAAADPSPTPTAVCPPVLPISLTASAITATSVTINYSIMLRPPCGYDPPVTVTFFGSLEDAQRVRNPLAEAVSGPERYGTVTVDGLTADTAYWYRAVAGGATVPYPLGSVRTAAVTVCAATVVIDNKWNGGFLATVAVRNVGTETLDGWRVTWRWSGGERIVSMWNAVREDSGADVTARNAAYNGRLAPGGSTTFGMLVASGSPPEEIPLTCGR